MRRCVAPTRAGHRCRTNAMADSDYCFWHDPATASARAAACRQGGYNTRRPRTPALKLSNLDLKTPAGLLAFAEEVMRATCNHGLSIERSRALGYLILAQNESLSSATPRPASTSSSPNWRNTGTSSARTTKILRIHMPTSPTTS